MVVPGFSKPHYSRQQFSVEGRARSYAALYGAGVLTEQAFRETVAAASQLGRLFSTLSQRLLFSLFGVDFAYP